MNKVFSNDDSRPLRCANDHKSLCFFFQERKLNCQNFHLETRNRL